MRKNIKTVYIPIFENGRKVHLATFRSDNFQNTLESLFRLFPKGYIKSANISTPLWYAAQCKTKKEQRMILNRKYY